MPIPSAHGGPFEVSTDYFKNKNGAGMNKHANPPRRELPPPTPSLENKAFAKSGNPLYLISIALCFAAEVSRERETTYAPKDDRKRSFSVKTDASSSGYESDK
jgi:hypothetical protein